MGLDRYAILDLIQQVDDQLAAITDRQHDVLIAGGAAVALLWDERRLTNDIDVVSEGMTPQMREAIGRVGRRNGHLELDSGWFNDAAKVAAPALETEALLVYDGERLRVYAASPRTVLAMKLFAARRVDLADIPVLMMEAGIASREELYDLVEAGYGPAVLRPATEYAIENVWEQHGQ